MGDPPLLRLESEASHAYLSVLLAIVGASPADGPPAPEDAPSQHHAPQVVLGRKPPPLPSPAPGS